jgi:hypothetical protein
MIYSVGFRDFWPILGDIRPFLRPNIGEKLGGCYLVQAYINQRFLKPWGRVQNRFMLEDF